MMDNLELNPILEKLRDSPNAKTCEFMSFQSFDDTEIFYRKWIPKGETKKIILIAHGMAGHGEFFVLLADKLVDKDIMIIAPDYRHHGRSEGKRGDLKRLKYILKDYAGLMEQIQAEYPGIPLYLLGESMGGLVSISFARFHEECFSKLSGLILFAPAVKVNFSTLQWMGIGILSPLILLARIFIPSKGIFSARGSVEEGIKNPFHQEYDETDPYHLDKVSMRYILQLFWKLKRAIKAAKKINIPTLIFQGAEDPVIDPEGVTKFYDHLKTEDKKLVLVKQAKHSLITDPAFQEKWEIFFKWLETH